MTTVDVEGFVNMSIDTIGGYGSFDAFLDALADGIGYPLLMDIKYEPMGVNEDKTVRIKVSGCVETKEDEPDVEENRPEATPPAQ